MYCSLIRRLGAIAIGTTLLVTQPALSQTARAVRPALTREEARARAARVSDVRYAIDITLDQSAPEYTGSVTSRFMLAPAAGAQPDLTVDFGGGSVRSLRVNGAGATIDYNGFFLTLAGQGLRDGANTVEIEYSHPYSNDGAGLYRFEDPEDGRFYLYTDFEPFEQNRLFPSFDQPDLKARYTTTVTAPSQWHVITNVRETDASDRGDRKVWHFPETLPISTYLFALHAGEYHEWNSSAGDIPLRLFARESLVPYIHAEHWFVPTQQGLQFYQRYFEMAYPFGKYDQIIVPHFNAGAMENVGAVTFSERYLSRGTVTRQDRRSLASVILHEMAHMWFGDVVTMDWWNGLWLNESFATFMSNLSMAEATEFTDQWLSGYLDSTRAYQADERDTTHPIELPIPDTDAAFANFDRITYDKGSAVLTQLNYLVGPEVFRRGVARYLAANAFGNTTIGNFLGAVSAEAGFDLGPWSRDWLQSPGTNQIEVSLTCDARALESVQITQRAPESWPTLRRHRAQLGLYRFTRNGVSVETLPVTYEGETTSADGAGHRCPDMIYANHGDWDFVRVRLDADAIRLLQTNLNRFDDAMTRVMLWQSVYDLVLDAGMAPEAFVDFAIGSVGAEPTIEVTSPVLRFMRSSVGWLERIADPATVEPVRARAERFLWSEVLASDPGSDRQLLYFDSYVGVAGTPSALDLMAAMLSNASAVPAGIALDQDRRWRFLLGLAATGDARAEALIATERAADPSDDGRLMALSATTALPDDSRQREFVSRILAPDAELSVADARAMASGLASTREPALQLEHALELLRQVERVKAEVDPIYYGSIASALLPVLCDNAYLDRLSAVLAAETDLHPTLSKALLDTRFEVRRCLRIAAAL